MDTHPTDPLVEDVLVADLLPQLDRGRLIGKKIVKVKLLGEVVPPRPTVIVECEHEDVLVADPLPDEDEPLLLLENDPTVFISTSTPASLPSSTMFKKET